MKSLHEPRYGQHGQLYLIPREFTFDLAVQLALTNGVRLLVCGNRLPFYDIAYELARRVGQHYERILKEQFFFSRAETCIQLVDFLCELETEPTPLIVSDLLSRFSEEDKRQVDNLFFQCQVELQRLSQSSLVFISAKARPPYERLWHALNRITQPIDSMSTRIARTPQAHGFNTFYSIRENPRPSASQISRR